MDDATLEAARDLVRAPWSARTQTRCLEGIEHEWAGFEPRLRLERGHGTQSSEFECARDPDRRRLLWIVPATAVVAAAAAVALTLWLGVPPEPDRDTSTAATGAFEPSAVKRGGPGVVPAPGKPPTRAAAPATGRVPEDGIEVSNQGVTVVGDDRSTAPDPNGSSLDVTPPPALSVEVAHVAIRTAAAGASGFEGSVTLLDTSVANEPLAGTTEPTSAADLMSATDDARRSGDKAEAVHLLRRLLRGHPNSEYSSAALLTLANLERDRGRHNAAARAYASHSRRFPDDPLASDALAGAASEYARAGKHDAASRLAARYLERFPDGIQRGAMQELLEGSARQQ